MKIWIGEDEWHPVPVYEITETARHDGPFEVPEAALTAYDKAKDEFVKMANMLLKIRRSGVVVDEWRDEGGES